MTGNISPFIRLWRVGHMSRLSPEVQLVPGLVVLCYRAGLCQVIQILGESKVPVLVLENNLQRHRAKGKGIGQAPISPREGTPNVPSILIPYRIGVFTIFVQVHGGSIGGVYTGIFISVKEVDRLAYDQFRTKAV